jgi:hypothetical protein
MDQIITNQSIFIPSEDIIAREIDGEILIIPITSGIGDMEDELYSLNETGLAIWKRLDGISNVEKMIEDIATEYEASEEEITRDVLDLLGELIRRKIILEKDAA